MDLNSIMEFDHVITVHEDGTVTNGPKGVYAPTMTDDQLDDRRWEFVTYGYTAQYGYRGPTMADCESIGGRLQADILAVPGVYAAIVSDHSCEEHGWSECTCDNVEGWAVARLRDAVLINDYVDL